MKFVNLFRRPISIFVIIMFTVLLSFWANQSPAAPSAPTSEKNSVATLAQGENASPNFFEQESADKAALKRGKKFPWLFVGLGVVVIGVAIYFLVIKKPKYTLTVTLGTGCTGTPATNGMYKKGVSVSYSYTPLAGFGNLTVKLDNKVVPNSGTVVMDTNRTLNVSAIEATYKNGVLLVNGVQYDMALIPSGEFQMGSNSLEAQPWEQPVHTVWISKSFWMGKTEVTQRLWRDVMGNNPSYFLKGDTYPVEFISWDDCQVFITKLNQMVGGTPFRLPTEAEWEYACRAGTTDDRYGNIDAIAWYLTNSGYETHPVGQKQPNAWGLYDTLGNVDEWCQDYFGLYKAGYQIDPIGSSSSSYRIQRGGDWISIDRYVRSAVRDWNDPGLRDSGLTGLRLASSSAGG